MAQQVKPLTAAWAFCGGARSCPGRSSDNPAPGTAAEDGPSVCDPATQVADREEAPGTRFQSGPVQDIEAFWGGNQKTENCLSL